MRESLKGKTIVGLLRGDTSTKWFHRWCLGKADIRFIKGRLKFGECGKPAPFPSILVIWKQPCIFHGVEYGKNTAMSFEG